MEWNKKTDEQYDAYMTVMAGGDNENEASLTLDEWYLITGSMGDLIGVLSGEANLENLGEEYEGLLPELRNVLIKLLDVEKNDNSPIKDFLERQKTSKDLEKITKELQAWKAHNKK